MSCPEVAVIVDMDQEHHRRWLDVADVILTGRAQDPPGWMVEAFGRFPGVAIVGVERGEEGGTLFGLRDGRLVTAAPGGYAAPVAAFLHGWLAAGRSIEVLHGAALSVAARHGLRRAVRVHIGRWDEGEQAAHVGRFAVRQAFVDPQRGGQVGPRARQVRCR